jgi:hypothetical protein
MPGQFQKELADLMTNSDMASPEFAEQYEALSQRYPMQKLAYSFHPTVGPMMGAADLNASLRGEHYGQAGLDALGMIPIIGGSVKAPRRMINYVKDAYGFNKASAEAKALAEAEKASKFREVVDTGDLSNRLTAGIEGGAANLAGSAPNFSAGDYPTMVAQAGGMKKGGQVKRMAKGGHVKAKESKPTASRRGDGIAQRGKTRGTFR